MIANELVHIFFHRRAYCVICTWNSFMTLFADDAVYVICKMHIADEKTHLTVSINVILHCGHKGNYHVICRIFRHFFLSQHSLNSWHLSEQFSVPLQLFLANFCTILVLLKVFQRYGLNKGKLSVFTLQPFRYQLENWALFWIVSQISVQSAKLKISTMEFWILLSPTFEGRETLHFCPDWTKKLRNRIKKSSILKALTMKNWECENRFFKNDFFATFW